jgi:hypothetical protein
LHHFSQVEWIGKLDELMRGSGNLSPQGSRAVPLQRRIRGRPRGPNPGRGAGAWSAPGRLR